MVSKEQVEGLMSDYFPSCPLCGSDEGWNASGIFKNYVQCISCGAKWLSNDFIKCIELKEMELWEPAKDGKGSSLLRKKHPITFWQSLDIEQLTEKEQIFALCDKCGKPIPTGSTYWYDKTKKSLPDKKFCSKQCFSEALAGQTVDTRAQKSVVKNWIAYFLILMGFCTMFGGFMTYVTSAGTIIEGLWFSIAMRYIIVGFLLLIIGFGVYSLKTEE